MPETQEWVRQTVYEAFQVLDKYAMVMPEDFFANLSADSNIDEIQKIGKVNIKQFASIVR